jgi:AraC family ethanolamine operon transcriptional activator
VRICRLVDEFLSDTAAEIRSSAEIADAVGVTIRTLHNAMTAVKGISLQKFMMLNRLWSVRTALLRAGPEDLIKTIALDHGFWHLGRFSRTYRAFFGESPSDTVRRSANDLPAETEDFDTSIEWPETSHLRVGKSGVKSYGA